MPENCFEVAVPYVLNLVVDLVRDCKSQNKRQNRESSDQRDGYSGVVVIFMAV